MLDPSRLTRTFLPTLMFAATRGDLRRLLGTVSTPPLVVTHIGRDFVAGTTRDELGVPRAAVYPLRR